MGLNIENKQFYGMHEFVKLADCIEIIEHKNNNNNENNIEPPILMHYLKKDSNGNIISRTKCDGIVFTPENNDFYGKQTDLPHLKWKPAMLNTLGL